jgi:hypothetical protein
MVQFIENEAGDDERARDESGLDYIGDASVYQRTGIDNDLIGARHKPATDSFTPDSTNALGDMQTEYLEYLSALSHCYDGEYDAKDDSDNDGA